ncbi:hypothetical protein P7E02_12345 [Enterococcus hulanensis]|uniref:hypothetical protein n=1 Tax=Enterococcus hulanensis TaxID=2559929 RepID=UPI002890BFC6|nr:hypothetical protein [Enterococcus hulanensis]MDT2660664.1 hypothetical protein [Enterococcus hulanensis]
MDNLTNDAKFLLSKMYEKYIEKRKKGYIKKDAKSFGNLEKVHSEIMSEWPIEDVLSTLLELRANEFIIGTPASTTMFHIQITNIAIAMLEKTFKDKVEDVLDFAAKIKSAIPFI